jgi:hypothetical protein
MRLSEAFPSNFLKADDVLQDTVLTIKGQKLQSIGQGAQAENKLVLSFQETDKELVVNKTNFSAIATALAEDDSDHWIGKRITLYATEVEYKGETMLGIRVRLRSPQQQSAKPGSGAAELLKQAKAAAWAKWKAKRPNIDDKASAAELRDVIGLAFDGRTPEQLGASEWKQLADADFLPPQPVSATKEFGDDDIPF